MPQTSALVAALKASLKSEGKTYADVAKALDLSEASVKRLFAAEDFSLERLDRICALIGIEISDLIMRMNANRPRLTQLAPTQEREIVEDLTLVLIMVCVFSGWTAEEIVNFYTISEAECTQKLLKLERLKLIELLPGNRIRLLIAPNFRWLENGPIQRFFCEHVGKEFFDTSFGESRECLIVLNGMLSERASLEFQKKLERLAKEFNELHNDDKPLPFNERHGTTLVMAMRRWEYGLFQSMIRKK